MAFEAKVLQEKKLQQEQFYQNWKQNTLKENVNYNNNRNINKYKI